MTVLIRFSEQGTGVRVKVVVDGRFVQDEADLHHRLAGAFGYGPSYRKDVESLRERLAGGDPRPVELIVTHPESIRLALGRAAYDRLVGVLEKIEEAERDRPWNERFVLHIFD